METQYVEKVKILLSILTKWEKVSGPIGTGSHKK